MPTHLTILAAIALMVVALLIRADTPAPSTQPATQRQQMERLSLVFLLTPDASVAMTAEQVNEIHQQHLAHLTEMNRQGKLVAAGPVRGGQDSKLRGICLYRTSLEEAKACAEADPAVRAGRFRVEVMDWYTLKGTLAFPLAPATQEAN